MCARFGLLTLLMSLIGILPTANGQENHSTKRNYPLKIASKDTTTLHRKQITFFPVIYRSPETGFAFGVLALGLFKMIGVKDSLTRTSNLEVPVIITSKNQFIVDVIYNLITNKERFFIRGFNQYNNFREYYYGIGNNTSDADRTTVAYNSFRTNHRIVARVEKRHFIGLQYQYYKVSNTSFLDTTLYNPNNSHLGYGGFTTAGLGPVYLYDSRDNVINSYHGTYLEISTLIASSKLGSQYDFNNFTVDARKFYPVGRSNVLAFQAIVNHNQGDLPWRQMAAMGGFSMMRGYYLGRHRDKNYAAFQAEYRLHVYKFFGMAFFAATGQVAPRMEDMRAGELKFAGGTGLRFQVDKKEKVNIRFDVGWSGSGQPGYYLTIGEAF